MKEIREWLANPVEYPLGVALYETHGKSRVVLNSLRHGETEFTRGVLRRELAKLAAEKIPSSPQNVPGSPAGESQKVVSSPEKVVSSPEKVVSSLDEQRRTWYATRAYAHAQLELVATGAERRDLSRDILELTEKIDASYRPPVPAEVLAEASLPLDAGEQRRQLTNLRAQASKLKKNPDRAGDLARVKTTITQLEAKLKRDGES